MIPVSVIQLLGLACLLGAPAPRVQREVPLSPEYAARHWTSSDGMPQDTVNSIVQSRDGYLWIATFGGLTRFDGVRFRTYTIAEAPELKTNRLVSVYEDESGALWLGTEGMGVVRMREGYFESFETGAPTGAVWDILEDAQGNLLFAGDGLSRFRDGLCERIADRDVVVFDMQLDRDGVLWLATSRGVKTLRAEGLRDELGATGPRNPHSIQVDPTGRLWISGADGTGYVRAGRFVRVLEGQARFPQRCFADRDGELWRADGERLLVVDTRLAVGGAPAPGARVRLFHPALEAGVRSYCEDSDGGLWVGTPGRGLLRVTRTPFARLDRERGLDGGAARVVGDGEDGVWIQTSRSLFHWKDELRPYDPASVGLSQNPVFLGQSRDGRLWFGAPGRLLTVAEDETAWFEDPDARDPLGEIVEMADGTVWIGSTGRLLSVRGREVVAHAVGGHPREAWRPVRIGADGALWFRGSRAVGRRTVGPAGETFETWGPGHGLPAGEVRDLHESADGSIWISTYGGGLGLLRGGAITTFGEPEGLADVSLGGILEDDDGRLWINSNRGVMVVPIAGLEQVLAGERTRAPCHVLQSGEGNGEFAHRTPDGHMWFPTIDAVAVVDPRAHAPVRAPPRVRIESVLADGRELQTTGAVAFTGGVEDLEVRYTGFSYSAPEQLRFTYVLEGYDEQWAEAGHRRAAFFTKVPPGRYVFRVRAEDENGILGETDAHVAIELEPRFWQTAWFIALCAAAAASLVWGLHRARVAEVERHAGELRRQIVERERAERERRKLEERLRESAKLEALGRLSGGIAHDFNNVLTAILGRASLLKHDAERGELSAQAQLDHVGDITACAERAAVLTQQLLAFSRQQVLKPSIVRPNDVIADLAPMLRQLLPENVELTIAPDERAGHVRVDEGQLQQVVMNLVLNARDALPDGGSILVETASVELDPEHLAQHPSAAPGSYVIVAVSDTGHGIGESVLPHVFDPFFTTKEQGRGTGLGLASVHGIVTQSGGHVQVQSEPGAGTTFRVYLPKVQALPRAPDSQPAPRHLDGNETILVCEDDEAIRRMMRMLLEPRGYTVLDSGRPRQALEIARETPRIDLLITDVVMPEMSGRDLAESLADLHPETQILYVSGYTSDVIVHQGVVEAGIQFLDKPFTPTQLLATARRVLDAPRSEAEDDAADDGPDGSGNGAPRGPGDAGPA